jgi:hypothetical protein
MHWRNLTSKMRWLATNSLLSRHYHCGTSDRLQAWTVGSVLATETPSAEGAVQLLDRILGRTVTACRHPEKCKISYSIWMASSNPSGPWGEADPLRHLLIRYSAGAGTSVGWTIYPGSNRFWSLLSTAPASTLSQSGTCDELCSLASACTH